MTPFPRGAHWAWIPRRRRVSRVLSGLLHHFPFTIKSMLFTVLLEKPFTMECFSGWAPTWAACSPFLLRFFPAACTYICMSIMYLHSCPASGIKTGFRNHSNWSNPPEASRFPHPAVRCRPTWFLFSPDLPQGLLLLLKPLPFRLS